MCLFLRAGVRRSVPFPPTKLCARRLSTPLWQAGRTGAILHLTWLRVKVSPGELARVPTVRYNGAAEARSTKGSGIVEQAAQDTGIGTLREHSLHAELKRWYARPGDRLEVPVDGYVIDIVRGGLLIEVQTGGFSQIKRKLLALVEAHPIRLVYPIAAEKWIVRTSADGGEVLGRRKSPKRGRVEELFGELVRFPELVAHPNFSIQVLVTGQEEVRCNDGQGSWRRRGWSIQDRRLVSVSDQVCLPTPQACLAMLPVGLPQPFSSRQLGRALGLQRRLAQQMAYCLRKMGAVGVVGKRRNALLYAVSAAQGIEPGDQRGLRSP